MHSQLTPPVASTPRRTPSTPPHAAHDAPAPMRDTALKGIERLMADALTALGTPAGAGPADAGSIEYASWLARLRRATP